MISKQTEDRIKQVARSIGRIFGVAYILGGVFAWGMGEVNGPLFILCGCVLIAATYGVRR